jgi:hypothetical protein
MRLPKGHQRMRSCTCGASLVMLAQPAAVSVLRTLCFSQTSRVVLKQVEWSAGTLAVLRTSCMAC